MTDDPMAALRTELITAARHRARTASARRPVANRRHPRHGPLLAALAALVVAAPATAALTGALGGRGTTPDGGTYTVMRYKPGATVPGLSPAVSATGPCEQTVLRSASGRLTGRATGCARGRRTFPQVPADQALNVGFMVVPGQRLMITGTASRRVRTVRVTEQTGSIELSDDGHGRLQFTAFSDTVRPTVRAYDGSGRQIGVFVVPTP